MTIEFNKRKILDPCPGCNWADKMVLNPAMIADPIDPDKIYLLFRATGSCPRARQPGGPLPYPIFLGFGESNDGGQSWDFDFSGPALAPRLDYACERFSSSSMRNGKMFDYANGCIEDPRLFLFEDEPYLSVACRAFPPGPYWEHDDPTQCLPQWALSPEFGKAVNENNTVTLLYKVHLHELAKRNYSHAFSLVAPLHQPDVSDDRDVVLFPRRLEIAGKPKIVCIHRPKYPQNYEIGRGLTAPSIFLSAADNIEDFYYGNTETVVFAVPKYEWEANRIGASFAPLELADGCWLLPYHGKQDDRIGYTQSFMIIKENGTLNLEILVRPAERLLFADQQWELEGDFNIPCLFTCAGILRPNGSFLMGYGAADRTVGLAEIDFSKLMGYLNNHSIPKLS